MEPDMSTLWFSSAQGSWKTINYKWKSPNISEVLKTKVQWDNICRLIAISRLTRSRVFSTTLHMQPVAVTLLLLIEGHDFENTPSNIKLYMWYHFDITCVHEILELYHQMLSLWYYCYRINIIQRDIIMILPGSFILYPKNIRAYMYIYIYIYVCSLAIACNI